jgi:tyrosine-protein phosphatase SIW14
MPSMPIYLRWFNIILVAGLLVGGPWAYLVYRQRMSRSFHVVEEGVLYRSGQLPVAGLSRIVHDYNIRTVISLREGDREDDQAEVKYCQRWGIKHVRIPPLAWWSRDGKPPVEAGLKVFREVMDNPSNHPVLIHCFAGIHRTGAYCAVYRMEHQDWSNERALAELRRLGYDNLDEEWDVRGFLEAYQPRHEPQVRPVSRRR